MKKAYQKYGKFFSFDIAYNIFKPTTGEVSSEYRLGVFIGVSPKKKTDTVRVCDYEQ
jgi:hypothetical protein